MAFTQAELGEIEDRRAAIKEAWNGVDRWIEKAFVVNASGRELASDIYANFRVWCEANNYRVMSQRALCIRLRERGFVRLKSGGRRFYLGGSLPK